MVVGQGRGPRASPGQVLWTGITWAASCHKGLWVSSCQQVLVLQAHHGQVRGVPRRDPTLLTSSQL